MPTLETGNTRFATAFPLHIFLILPYNRFLLRPGLMGHAVCMLGYFYVKRGDLSQGINSGLRVLDNKVVREISYT
jgi:hypothetical protein